MGRGLSDLQKAILGIAYRNRNDKAGAKAPRVWDEREPPTSQSAELWWDEYHRYDDADQDAVLIEGFKTPVRLNTDNWHDVYRNEILCEYFKIPLSSHPRCSGKVFSPEHVNGKRYRSARASLSRALKRLHERGLIDCGGSPCSMTDAGVEVAKSLPRWVFPKVVGTAGVER